MQCDVPGSLQPIQLQLQHIITSNLFILNKTSIKSKFTSIQYYRFHQDIQRKIRNSYAITYFPYIQNNEKMRVPHDNN